MSDLFTQTRVSFVRKRPGVYNGARITPVYYGTNQSMRSDSVLSNSRFISTSYQPFQHNLNSRGINNRKQTIPLTHQRDLDNHQKRRSNSTSFSCKQYCLFFTLLFNSLLILITFVLPYVLIYLLSQKVTYVMQSSQTNVLDVLDHKYHCGGIETTLRWTTLTVNIFGLLINTSSCHFNTTPLYFTSFGGSGYQYGLAGYNGIYGATQTSFTIFVSSIVGWTESQMRNFSIIGNWSVNWLGITY